MLGIILITFIGMASAYAGYTQWGTGWGIATGVMVMIMLVCNLRYGQAAGVVSVLVFSLYGILMQPDTIQLLLRLPDEAYYIANVTIGWLSPLNHATFHMHNFGYDKLPRLWQSYTIFISLIVICYFAAVRAAKRYNFNFTGTEG